jgi:hypothetical protein
MRDERLMNTTEHVKPKTGHASLSATQIDNGLGKGYFGRFPV